MSSDIEKAIGDVTITSERQCWARWPDPPVIVANSRFAPSQVRVTASGGIFSGAQVRLIGEAGPEAVVPLRRSLSMVDPAVRALSAFAQGLTPPGDKGGGGSGRNIEVGGITINTPTENPRAVAAEVIARMASAAYI